ncbi:MAG: PQQ-dependent sugar dehydrogenase [Reichenbachiella sp.]
MFIPEIIKLRRSIHYWLIAFLSFIINLGYSQEIIYPGVEQFQLSQISPSKQFDVPFELLKGNEDWLWVTERGGNHRILRVNKSNGDLDVLIQMEDVSKITGMALDPLFGIDGQHDFTYVVVSTSEKTSVVKFDYNLAANDGILSNPDTIITGLSSSNGHVSGRLRIGPDEKLYMTLGDMMKNHADRRCEEVLAQYLPTQEEIDAANYQLYEGKILRMNLDGSIPEDNPIFNSVKSHIYTIGHRNPQGLYFGSNGILYSSEHGPATDDEVNIIQKGGNYGWPYIAGYIDDKNYFYCNRSKSENCSDAWDILVCPDGSETSLESDRNENDFVSPIVSMFVITDPADLNNDCDVEYMCRPGVAPSSIVYYEEGQNGIPGWGKSLLIPSLKRGSIFRYKLNDAGTKIIDGPFQHFNTVNRYRDIVIGDDNRSFYVVTNQGGAALNADGSNSTTSLTHPGMLLKFEYELPVAEEIVDLCPGETYMYQGEEISSSASFTSIIQNQFGVDSLRTILTITMHDNPISLGEDKTIDFGQELSLNATDGYSSYLWSDGSTASSIVFRGDNEGVYEVWARVEDAYSCIYSDTVQIIVNSKLLAITTAEDLDAYFYPNPARELLQIRNTGKRLLNVKILNLSGQIVKSWGQVKDESSLLVSDILPGLYIVEIDRIQGRKSVHKLLIE